jgi:hydroxymethylpyrimidine/phosphomethylpyrimidine kinase
MTKVALTIAGLDPSGGAGIIADIKTFSAFGCFATAAVASLTFQNTVGVFGAANQTAEIVREQVEPILRDFTVSALKTGMLPTREVIEEVARLVRENNLGNFVVDPVVRSTSGFDLIDDAALQVLIEKLFPLSTVITPNIPEAERIARMKIENIEDIRRAAQIMQNLGAKAVLIKGGHLPIADFGLRIADLGNKSNGEELTIEDQRPKTEDRKSIDFLFTGKQELTFSADFIETTATHGTGCTFAAAIAANLANEKTLPESIEAAKRFVTEAIRTAPNLGHGHSPVNHSITGF